MIKIENVEVVGWEHALRGMRNPKNSWEKSDTEIFITLIGYTPNGEGCYEGYLGDNDRDLCNRLANGGPVHAKYRRMITVYLDVVAPLYWWKEYDTYKVGTVANSCSTMHKIHEKEFTLDDFSCEHLNSESLKILENVIWSLNISRDAFRSNTLNKDFWWQMIQLLPSSYNQRRTLMLNYEVLANIYRWRKDHKLDEWKDFCKWIESLPYSELITGPSLSDIPICNEIMDEAVARVKKGE